MQKLSVFECILTDLYDIPLQDALAKYDIKTSSFFNYLAKHPEAKLLYDTHTQNLARKLALDCVAIADNDADPVRARVRIQARQWLAAKYAPKEYGERIDVNVQTVDLTDALREARERRERVLHPSFTEPKALTHVANNMGIQRSNATDLESVASLDSMLD